MNLEFLFSRNIIGLIVSVVGIVGLMALYWRQSGREMNVEDVEEKDENGE